MKKLNSLLLLLVMIMTSGIFTSCEPPEPELAPADAVSGTYVGIGKLTYYGIEIESFAGMKIVVSRSSEEYVLVALKEADDTDIFQKSSVFQVLKTSSNSYVLRSADNPSTDITIDSNYNMVYNNPSVTVSGEDGYTISFSGKRE